MDTEILKPKDFVNKVFFTEESLDFIFKVISYENKTIKLEVLYNCGDKWKDQVGKVFEISEREFKEIVEEHKFKELEYNDRKSLGLKRKFFKVINSLTPKNEMDILSKSFGDEKKEWKLNPKPARIERTINEESVLRMMAFMNLDHVTIRNILIDILDDKYYEILTEGSCKKEFQNDKPYEVIINHYSSIIIGWTGISYEPEHGQRTTLIEGYVIDGILKHFADLDLWEPNK